MRTIKDVYLGITSKPSSENTKDPNTLILKDGPTGEEFASDQFIFVTGRIVADPPVKGGVALRTPHGKLTTGCYWINKEGKLMSSLPGTSWSGRDKLNIPLVPMTEYDDRAVKIPTLVTNAFGNDKPKYIKLFATGKDALALSQANKGSQAYIFAEGWTWVNIGCKKLKCLRVSRIDIRMKGGNLS